MHKLYHKNLVLSIFPFYNKEKEFINGYFGLNGYESTTMVKLADELNVKHQRISSIKQQVLKKLRKHLPEKSYNDLILALNS